MEPEAHDRNKVGMLMPDERLSKHLLRIKQPPGKVSQS